MYPRYTPYSIIKDRQQQFIATILIITLILSTTYYLFTSNQASATTTYTWDEVVTLDRTTQTDTTVDDFEAGSVNEGLFDAVITNNTDGEVSLDNYSYIYNNYSDPILLSGLLHTFLDNNLLYISTNGNGFFVINTEGTLDPTDDTLVTRYHTGSVPALPHNSISHSFINNGLLYLSTWGGLSVIDIGDPVDPDDDELITTYNTGSSPVLASNSVHHTFLANDLLYVSTEGGLSVINTQGTIDPGDDTLVTRYHTGSTPALASNDVYHSFIDNNLLYVSTSGGYTNGGLSVINTQGTIDPGDDTLVTRYYTGSVPALASDYLFHTSLVDSLLYVSTWGGGLSVINTQGTIDPGDDTLVTRYYTGSVPALAGDNVTHSFLDNDLLYISTKYGSGLSVINIGDPINSGDDVLITTYNTGSSPSLSSNNVSHSFLANDLLYISEESGGLSVVGQGIYAPNASYLGSPQPLATTPTTSISYDTTVTSNHDVTLQYRTGPAAAVWRDDFETTDSYVGDLYEWTPGMFGGTSIENGILTLSDPPETNWTVFWFDTGYPEDHFPAGSVITARVRANISDPGVDYDDWMFVDDWESNDVEYTITNEWVTLTLVAESDFSSVGFEPSLSGGNFGPLDTFQIDYLSITPPIEWNAWSSDCTESTCPIDPDDLTGNSWIQYRLDLATENPLTTPSITSVSYNGPDTRIYTSTTETFANTQNLLTLDVTDDIPDDTTITYEYSTDNATTWTPITPGTTINQSATNFTWRATLTTTNPTITPTITNVTLSTTQPKNSTATSISKRIASLEAEGKLTEAEALRKQYQDLLTIGNTREIQLEIIKKATEVVTLLERMIRLKQVK